MVFHSSLRSVQLAVDEVGKLRCGVVLVRNVSALQKELQLWLQLVWVRLHADHTSSLSLLSPQGCAQAFANNRANLYSCFTIMQHNSIQAVAAEHMHTNCLMLSRSPLHFYIVDGAPVKVLLHPAPVKKPSQS